MPKIISDETVFRATVTTLIERGYAGATTKVIADAAGINEGTLFRKYGSKPKLIISAIGAVGFRFDPNRVRYTGDLTADLRAAAEAYSACLDEGNSIFPVVLSEMARFPELREAVTAPHRFIRALASVMGRYVDEATLRTEESPLQAVASFLGPLIVIGMLQGAAKKIAPASLDLNAHVERFVRARTAS